MFSLKRGFLIEILRSQGEWIFRRRGYLPLLFLPVLFFAGCDKWSNSCHELKGFSYDILCYLISLSGLTVRILTIGFIESGTSGRGRSQKAKSLNTEGLYSITRNPLYLGNFLAMLGVIVLFGVWWLILIFLLSFWLYYERVIIAEESYLREKFGKDYEIYVERTPPFIPDVRLLRLPPKSFSFRRVLRREYPGFLLVTVSFFSLITLRGYLACGKLKLDPFWMSLSFVSFFISLVIWALKKWTPYLREKT